MPLKTVQHMRMRGIGLSRERGAGLVETLIAVAIAAIAITALLAALSTGSIAVQRSDKRVTAENLARAQMEYTKAQTYLAAPTAYTTIAAPNGYSILAKATSISGRDADIQKITVTVSYNDNTLALEGFKVNR